MGELDYGTDAAEVERIATQVAAVRERGVEVAIVVGAGNIYRGLDGAAARHGPGHRRLHGDAGDGAQRADPAGRAREARRSTRG